MVSIYVKETKTCTLFSLEGWKVRMIDHISSKSWFCIQDIKVVMGVSMIVGVSTLRKSYNLLTLMKFWQYNLQSLDQVEKDGASVCTWLAFTYVTLKKFTSTFGNNHRFCYLLLDLWGRSVGLCLSLVEFLVGLFYWAPYQQEL